MLRLPLSRADLVKPQPKIDLDDVCLRHGPHRLQRHIDDAPLLTDYYQSLPRSLCDAASIPPPATYPTRRARPQRIPTPSSAAAPTERLTLERARADIRQQVAQHAQQRDGILVLAHPPGAGKGYNTVEGLKGYLRSDPDPGFIIWTSLADDHGNLYSLLRSGRTGQRGARRTLSWHAMTTLGDIFRR